MKILSKVDKLCSQNIQLEDDKGKLMAQLSMVEIEKKQLAERVMKLEEQLRFPD